MGDMTYDEIKSLKSDIQEFSLTLKKYGEENSSILRENDISFFNFISKRIIFFKYFYSESLPYGTNYFCQVLISDFYYLIISLIKHEMRYVYVNERSIIENFCRLLTKTTDEESHVTGSLIDSLKDKEYLFELKDTDFSLIKSEYATACEYIHGGKLLEGSLVYIFEESVRNNWTLNEVNDYYERVKKLLKIFDKMLISEYKEYVDGCFHRRKSLLEYLVGKETMGLLFK